MSRLVWDQDQVGSIPTASKKTCSSAIREMSKVLLLLQQEGKRMAKKDISKVDVNNPQEMPTSYVGLKATEIWDLLQRTQAALQEKQEILSSSDLKEQASLDQLLSRAKTLNVEDVRSNVNMTQELIEGLHEGLQSLVATIEKERETLGYLVQIGEEEDSLLTLQKVRAEFLEQKKAEAQQIIDDAKDWALEHRTEASTLLETAKEDIERMHEEADIQRGRAQEEWEYNFERQKKAALDELSDKAAMQTKLFTEREERLNQRSEALEAQKKALEALEEEIKKQTKAEVAMAENRVKRDMKIEFNEEKNNLLTRIAVNSSQLDNANQLIGQLRDELKAARAEAEKLSDKVTEVATAALAARADTSTINEVAKLMASGQQFGKK